MTWRNWEGNRAKALTREFERNNPFEEIYPPRLTDSLGHDVLQNTLQMCASNYESRFDLLPGVVGPLTNLYQLRQQAGAEEWPVAAEPIVDDLPGGAHQPSPTAPPAGGEVTVALHEIAAIGVSILFSTWMAVRFLALSISQ